MIVKLKAKDLYTPQFPFWIKKYYQTAEYPRHSHEFLEFFYVWEGKAYHYVGNKKMQIIKSDIFMINPLQNHKFILHPGTPLEIITCVFSPSFLDPHIVSLKKMKSFLKFIYLEPFYNPKYNNLHLTGTIDIKVRSLLQEMLEEYTKKYQGYDISIKAKLIDLLITVVRVHEKYENDRESNSIKLSSRCDAIFDTIKFLNEHFKEKFTLSEVAKKSYLNPQYFCELFKKLTGKTYIEYITDLRINYVCKLLKTTQQSITSICYDSGFNELSHFEHIFHRTTGLTPKQYRNKYHKKTSFLKLNK